MADGEVPQEPKDGQSPKKADAPKVAESQVGGWVKAAGDKVVPLLVSAVVSVGFVALAGKAVLWTRFEALQVPPDQVVQAVPQSQAVAIGASMLLIFGLLGVLATLGVYLVDRAGRATPGMSRGLLVILAVEGTVAIWLAEGKSPAAQLVAAEALLLAVGAISWMTFVGELIDRDREVPDFKGDEDRQEVPPRAFFHEDGKSGITKLGLFLTAVLALDLGLSGYLVAVTSHASHWLALAIGLGGVGLGLAAAVLWHVHCFDRDVAIEVWNEEKRKRRVRATTEREKAEKERRKDEKKREAESETAYRWWRRRGGVATLWTALCEACRRDAPQVTVNVGAPGDDAKGAGSTAPAASVDADPDRTKPPGFSLEPRGIILIVALVAVAIGVPSAILHEWWMAVALGVVAILGAGLWRVAELSNTRFVWYGLAVFISVPLFGTVMLMARNIDEPLVQPMAMIRNTDGPDESIQGLYVTETSDRVYFANVATEGCEEKVTPHSGRLLWVPKDEVVAMALGPAQNVEQAGRSALEMSYDLTPGIETGSATIDLPEPEPATPAAPEAEKGATAKSEESEGDTKEGETEGDKGKEGDETEGGEGEEGEEGEEGGEGGGEEEEKEDEEEATGNDRRLKNVGPAVRPNFGTGLRIEPEIVSPGAEATLRLSRENPSVEGFGPARAGHNLRLGGKVVDVSKEPAGAVEGSEYIETEHGRLISVGKEGPYVEVEKGKLVLEEKADDDDRAGGEGPFVRLDDPAVLKVGGEAVSEDEPEYVRVEKDGEGTVRVARGAKTVTLVGGAFEGHVWELEKGVVLAERPLLRQAWHSDHIRFHVPVEAHSGVVTVECDQLAGAPLLQVSHRPTARLEVWAARNSTKVFFDSTRSSDEDNGEEIKRRWKVDGVRAGHSKTTYSWMAPGRALHRIELTVTDKAGNADTATLLMLRLPTPGFGVGIKDPAIARAIAADRKAIDAAVEAERPKEIELDGYTDAPRRAAPNLKRALVEAKKVRRNLLPEPAEFPKGERAVPIAELAHGQSCQIYPATGRRPANRHVDLFILDEDVMVKTAEGCQAKGQQSARWHPPATSKTLASISSVPGTSAAPSP